MRNAGALVPNRGGSDQDAQLLWQATSRAEALLDALDGDRAHKPELEALLGFLREVVLARVAEEERGVLRALRQSSASQPDLDCLHQDHVALRDNVDELVEAATAHDPFDPARLAAVTRRLIDRLEKHLRAEAAVLSRLSAGNDAGAAGWVSAQRWYPLTEGSVIYMGRLRPDEAEDAVLNRLVHLRADEQVELRGHDDHSRLWPRLQQRAPGGYRWSEQRDEGGARTVLVQRRPDQ